MNNVEKLQFTISPFVYKVMTHSLININNEN